MSHTQPTILPPPATTSCFNACYPRGCFETIQRHPILSALYMIALVAVIYFLASDLLEIEEKLILGCSAAGAHVIVAFPYFCWRGLQRRTVHFEDLGGSNTVGAAATATSPNKTVDQSFTSVASNISETSFVSDDLAECDVSNVGKLLIGHLDRLLSIVMKATTRVLDYRSIGDKTDLGVPKDQRDALPTLFRCQRENCWYIKVLHQNEITFLQVVIDETQLVQIFPFEPPMPNATILGMIGSFDSLIPQPLFTFHVNTQGQGRTFLANLFLDQGEYRLALSPLERFLNALKGDQKLTVGKIEKTSQLGKNSKTLTKFGDNAGFIKVWNKQSNSLEFIHLQFTQGGVTLSYYVHTAHGYVPDSTRPAMMHPSDVANNAHDSLRQIFAQKDADKHATYDLAPKILSAEQLSHLNH